MELTTLLYLILAVLAGAGFAYLMLRRTTPAGQSPGVDDLFGAFQDAAVIAQTLVAAAEQLAETGQIDRNARFNYVFERLRQQFPGLSQDLLIAVIEGAVWVVTKSAALLEVAEPRE